MNGRRRISGSGILLAAALLLLLGIAGWKYLPGSVFHKLPVQTKAPELHYVVTESGALLNINAADPDELMLLPGIGEALAERIVEFRTENGPFSDISELVQVSGIGEGTLSGLESMVCAIP